MAVKLPIIPEILTVHLGEPDDTSVANVSVSFPDYIKNVASSEIYPTWPDSALRANIYAQISFALNRIYTEYYRVRGYTFDITNSPAYDQAFIYGRNIFDSINSIVDEIFNNYLVRSGFVEPLFAEYCNGTTVTCDGLSQWGSVSLAEEGYIPIEILQYYYGGNLEIVRNAPIEGIVPSQPLRPLRLGSTGNEVVFVQLRLNRISTNYPSIPKIPNTTGIFDIPTENAVREFQRIFNLTIDGIVGKETWYRIQYIYSAVKKLNELDSEGLTFEEVSLQFPENLKVGDTGNYVRVIQYLLAYVAKYEPVVPPIEIDGIFGPLTEQAIIAFQKEYGLEPTGIMDVYTYSRLYDVYQGIIQSLPESLFVTTARPYPGTVLTLGVKNQSITYLQEYLNTVSDVITDIPKITVNGVFDTDTENAVKRFQEIYGLEVNGIVNTLTWNSIAEVYNDIKAGEHINPEQNPGYTVQ